jgi:glycerophosphoryl diester phosphodiesterase
MKKHLKYTAILSAFALYSLYSTPSDAADKSIDQIISALAGDQPGVRIAPTHRGRYRDNNGNAIANSGENSYTAITLAANANALAIELDDKSSSDSYPIASHDYVIGRVTSYTHQGGNQYIGQCSNQYCDYSPYSGIGWNPSVSNTTVTQWTNRWSRNFSLGATTDTAPIFPNVVNNAVNYGMVPLIDLKSAGDEANLASVAWRSGSKSGAAVEKVPLGSYTVQTFQNIRAASYRVAVIANGDANNIIANAPGGDISLYMLQIMSYTNAGLRPRYFEITVKNDSSGVNDPMLPYYRYATSKSWTTGSFNPVAEYGSAGFFRSDTGFCCAYDNNAADWSATSRLGTDPLPDLRTNGAWIAARNTVVISDVPTDVPIGIW